MKANLKPIISFICGSITTIAFVYFQAIQEFIFAYEGLITALGTVVIAVAAVLALVTRR